MTAVGRSPIRKGCWPDGAVAREGEPREHEAKGGGEPGANRDMDNAARAFLGAVAKVSASEKTLVITVGDGGKLTSIGGMVSTGPGMSRNEPFPGPRRQDDCHGTRDGVDTETTRLLTRRDDGHGTTGVACRLTAITSSCMSS